MNFSPQLPFDFSITEKNTFDNFLVSARNTELVDVIRHFGEAGEGVAFIWGREGVGKTHLLQAFCQECEKQGRLQALYLPVGKIRLFGPDVFASLHHMDLICLDDLQEIIGDKSWEESLFAFFNRSREAGVKLLVAADNPPRGLAFSLPDLASRMSWGMVYQLHELQDEDKLAALSRRAGERHMPLSREVLQYIYSRHPRDLQSLLDVIDRLDKLSLSEKRRLTIPFVRRVLGWQ